MRGRCTTRDCIVHLPTTKHTNEDLVLELNLDSGADGAHDTENRVARMQTASWMSVDYSPIRSSALVDRASADRVGSSTCLRETQTTAIWHG